MPIIHDRDVDDLLAVLLKEIESEEMCSFMNYREKIIDIADHVNLIILQVLLFSVVVVNLDSGRQLNVLTVEKITKITNVI